MKSKLIFLAGPTAVGKSEAAVYLARKLNGEVISCDSMQIYQGMDIITSKAPLALRRKAPHHLLDIVRPDKEYNVSRYRREAIKKMKEVLGRGKVPVFCGGTGLYMSILLDGIFPAAGGDRAIRARLHKEIEERGLRHLYRRLKKVDPQAARKIHPHDARRIVRALEVFTATSRPISELQKERHGLRDEYDVRIFCLDMEKDKLRLRIKQRVKRMFAAGLLKEVKRLSRLKLSKTARYAIGISELQGYFDKRYGIEEAKRLMERNTWHYARRQLTWFRKVRGLKWLEVSDRASPQAIAERIWKELY